MLQLMAWGVFVNVFSACSVDQSAETLTIATAANVQFAMRDLVKEFTQQTKIPCQIITGSSGNLTAQIKNGAPYHLFVSANVKYPDELHQSNFSLQAPKIYAYGKLVLWTLKDLDLNLQILTLEEIKNIALANPKNAPYGQATLAYLQKKNLETHLKSKLIYGESISQVNQFVFSKSVDIGFTAKSVVLAPEMKNKGKWLELPSAEYPKIAQSMVILKNSPQSKIENAKKFYKFLTSSKAKGILESYGYQIDVSL